MSNERKPGLVEEGIDFVIDYVIDYDQPKPEPELARILKHEQRIKTLVGVSFAVPKSVDKDGKKVNWNDPPSRDKFDWQMLDKFEYPIYVFKSNMNIIEMKMNRYEKEILRIKRINKKIDTKIGLDEKKAEETEKKIKYLTAKYKTGLETSEFTYNSDTAKSLRKAILAAKKAVPSALNKADYYFIEDGDIDMPETANERHNTYDLIEEYESRVESLNEKLRANRQWLEKAKKIRLEALDK